MAKNLTFIYGERKLDLAFPETFLAGDMVYPRPNKNKLNADEMIAMIDAAPAKPQGAPLLRSMVHGKRVGLPGLLQNFSAAVYNPHNTRSLSPESVPMSCTVE